MNSIKRATNIILVVIMIFAIVAGTIACGGKNNDNPVDVNAGNTPNKSNATANPDVSQKQPNSTPRPDQGDTTLILGHTPETVLLKVIVGEEEFVFNAADLSDLETAKIVKDSDSSSRTAAYIGVSLGTILRKVQADTYETLIFKDDTGKAVDVKFDGMDIDASVLAAAHGDKAIAEKGNLITFFAVDETGKIIDSKPISVIEVTLKSAGN